jgi:hypothetical protein
MARDDDILEQIELLVREEHELLELEAAEGPTDGTRGRVDELAVTLDRLWDLLRQRRALRDAGRRAEGASLRDGDTVEEYEQ